MKWEADVLLWIQDNLRNAVLDPICKLFGWIGAHGELAIAVALLLMIIPKTRRTGCVCA
jgi:undecaprenyl-diphosphatase